MKPTNGSTKPFYQKPAKKDRPPEPNLNGHSPKPGKLGERILAAAKLHAQVPISPSPEGKGNGTPAANGSRVSTVSTVSRDFSGYAGVIGEVAEFIAKYIVLPRTSILVISAWVAASWLMDVWDRFPHLAISSPEKRCGKTLLLELLALIVNKPRTTTNISPAALYRVVQQQKPTLLMDECQSLKRRGSEASEVMREILNAGIGKDAKVTRCGGKDHDRIDEFSVYSPKVFAMIGEPDGVLADRCLPVAMKRKTEDDHVERYRSRQVKAAGEALQSKLKEWAKENEEGVKTTYDAQEPFDIDNDRMADLLTPLQAVLVVIGGDEALMELRGYATDLDARDREQETQSPGVQLLAACREIYEELKKKGKKFLQTDALISLLVDRDEEPWHRWNDGDPISREKLAWLLRPYGIRSKRDKGQQHKGYFSCDFEESWKRYLSSPASLENPANPANPPNPSTRKGGRP